MHEITPENANTWRDLTDQLSADQIAELENLERDPQQAVPAHW